ncbi:esterase family protein [Streptococcus gallolyticus]|uniref:alpha/beta hydrolase n=1 Tax=Streptococcus hepaticus TaxID=3349163 RepID=UPI001C9479EF|nr:esterase family protein [Streptococcus gallolyticus]MBY5041096.1 esterase family protein [Streptococcus gallolyticus]
MAVFEIEYSSAVLGQYRQVSVIYPDADQLDLAEVTDTDIPVLYLLHGMGGNHNSWRSRTNLERLVRKTNLIIVMPDTQNGWYTNTKYGVKYYDAVVEELPAVLKRFFPNMTQKREKTFIAGLSMGGYGAFKLAFLSNRFAYAGSFSGALMFDDQRLVEIENNRPYWEGIFGNIEEFDASQDNLLNMVEHADGKTKFYAWCGKEDFLYSANNQAVKHFEDQGLDITYRTDHGTHDWYYWEKQIEIFLEMLPIHYVKEERLS